MSNQAVKCDVNGLVATLERFGSRVAKGAAAAIQEGAEEILLRAVEYVPVDEHNLEKALDIDVQRRDEQGRFIKARWKIYVRDEYPASDGKTVGQYAMVMHEKLAPYGSGEYHLGEASRQKAAAGNAVGGKFLERAANDTLDHTKRAVQYAVSELFKGKAFK